MARLGKYSGRIYEENEVKDMQGCNDLFKILSNQSMSGVTMERLAEMIADIGYELKER